MKISINAPSYKRPGNVMTLCYLPSCRIWVCESELDEYTKMNPGYDIVGVPKGVQGNLCRIRNYILDHAGTDVVCLIDDDMSQLGYYEGTVRHGMNEREVKDFLWRYSFLAMELGVHLWGVNINIDKQCYREYTPFSMLSYIGGPFSCHINSDLRYDENLPLKEDYDLTLQHLNKYRKVLRVNKYNYMVKQGGSGSGQVGGCAVMRNINEERRQLELLRKKWGRDIIREDLGESRSHSTTKKQRYDVNPIMRVPIRGV